MQTHWGDFPPELPLLRELTAERTLVLSQGEKTTAHVHLQFLTLWFALVVVLWNGFGAERSCQILPLQSSVTIQKEPACGSNGSF